MYERMVEYKEKVNLLLDKMLALYKELAKLEVGANMDPDLTDSEIKSICAYLARKQQDLQTEVIRTVLEEAGDTDQVKMLDDFVKDHGHLPLRKAVSDGYDILEEAMDNDPFEDMEV